eukprot:SAG11_NODE_111_length_16190_cov_9.912808_1_plen_272_part_00
MLPVTWKASLLSHLRAAAAAHRGATCRTSGSQLARRFGCKVDYYYSQAATQITYWKTIQAHSVLPFDRTHAEQKTLALLQNARGLASVTATQADSHSSPSFASATAALHAADDGANDNDFPPRVLFLPMNCSPAPELQTLLRGRGVGIGVSLPLACDASDEEVKTVVAHTQQAKSIDMKVKVVLHGALDARPTTLSYISALLGDAGADILMLDVLGGGVDQDDIEELVESMTENDIVGVPMAMRVGMRFGAESTGTEDDKALKELIAHSVE